MFNGKRIDELEGKVECLLDRLQALTAKVNILSSKILPQRLLLNKTDSETGYQWLGTATDDDIKAAYKEIMARESESGPVHLEHSERGLKAESERILADMRLAGTLNA